MALTYGAKVENVSMTSSVRHVFAKVKGTVSPLHVTMLITLAGGYAEARLRNDYDAAAPGIMGGGPHSDYGQASDLAMRHARGNRQEADELLVQASNVAYANTMDEYYWKAVTAVASELLDRETLNEDHLREVILSCGGIPPQAVKINVVKKRRAHPS
jgi:hypothetical protein